MYESFFGLTRSPFRLAPDPRFFFLTESNREALAGLTCAITGRAGLAVVSGDAGTGKTTLLRTFLSSFSSSQVDFSYVLTPTLSTTEFLQVSLADFGLTALPPDKAGRLSLMQKMLVERRAQNRIVVLVVDEAHKLPLEVLEELRLLTNFEDPEGKLLQIVLSGQNELDEILRREDLRQFKQRVAYRFAIQPLSSDEVGQYVEHRWQRAGDHQHHPFTEDAVRRIAQCSRGIPRVVNTICDNALLTAFGCQSKQVTREHVDEAILDLDLGQSNIQRLPRRPVSPASVSAPEHSNGSGAAAEPHPPGPVSTRPASEEEASLHAPKPGRPRKERFIRLGL